MTARVDAFSIGNPLIVTAPAANEHQRHQSAPHQEGQDEPADECDQAVKADLNPSHVIPQQISADAAYRQQGAQKGDQEEGLQAFAFPCAATAAAAAATASGSPR